MKVKIAVVSGRLDRIAYLLVAFFEQLNEIQCTALSSLYGTLSAVHAI